VGHGAIIHGSIIGNNCLIGMRATILNGAKIGNNCIIGAHALVTENMIIPDNSMVLGTPGKVVKTLDADGVKMSVMLGVEEYLAESKRYLGI
jgi:carbonic anhydrase/acetyltransferase-like protein (isoleucine patch superfamily)